MNADRTTIPVTVMITTRNRIAILRQTLQVLAASMPAPAEILVTADDCSDDTVTMIRQEFPTVRLTVNGAQKGSVWSRDEMLRQASHDLVLSLDDDSYPVAMSFFGRLPELFELHPEAAVITFPELRDDGVYASSSETPTSEGHYVSAYANCAAAMRRDVYLQSPGFPRFFEHMYEEPDYALQCYARQASVWFEPSLVIRHHLSSVAREHLPRHHKNARNELWSVWMRCPWPWLPVVSAFRVWRQFRFASTKGFTWALREPLWWADAVRGLGNCLRMRTPTSWSTYLFWMKLSRIARSPAIQKGAGFECDKRIKN